MYLSQSDFHTRIAYPGEQISNLVFLSVFYFCYTAGPSEVDGIEYTRTSEYIDFVRLINTSLKSVQKV
jgi:hypothetical protein